MADQPKPLPYLVHCEPCGGNGLRLNRDGQFETCPVCGGQGRRVVHPYRAGGGEQGDAP